ncbi:hypothetical protein C8J56DRAFT_952428 [Mycena floridula]|nr:hypothetical protein C8J56DRAFT_952428 [Mycena floridula]
MLKSHRHPDTVQQQAEVLCCTEDLTIAALHSIFSACSGLRTIGIFIWADEGQEALAVDVALDALASAGPRSDGSDRFYLPLFQNVTHLELDVTQVDDFDGKRLFSLANLTHLSLVDLTSGEFYDRFIQQLPLADSIMVCILYSASYFGQDTIDDAIADARIIAARSPDQRDNQNASILWRDFIDERHYIRQWGRRTCGEELDMWDEAEEIVKVQQAKLTAAE